MNEEMRDYCANRGVLETDESSVARTHAALASGHRREESAAWVEFASAALANGKEPSEARALASEMLALYREEFGAAPPKAF